MKKALNILYVFLAVIGGIWLSAQLFFIVILPLGPVQRQLQKTIAAVSGVPVSFNHITAGFTFISLSQFRVASACAEEPETDLFYAENIFLKWSPWKLLRKHIHISSLLVEEPEITVFPCSNGRLNTEFFPSADTKKETASPEPPTSFSWYISAGHLRLMDGRIAYIENTSGRRARAEKFFFEVHDFTSKQTFPLSLNARLSYEEPAVPMQEAELGLRIWPKLQGFEWEQAALDVKSIVVKHAGGIFALSGQLNNFLAPQLQFELTGRDINSELIRPFYSEVLSFFTDLVSIGVTAEMKPGMQMLHLSSFTVYALDSVLTASGHLDLARPEQSALDGTFQLNLQRLANAVEMLQPYRITGELDGQAVLKSQLVSAQAHLSQAGAEVPAAGSLTNVNTDIILKDFADLQMPKLTGNLNESAFTASLFAEQTEHAINADIQFSAPRVVLPPLAKNEAQPAADSAAEAVPPSESSASSKQLNISADINIGTLDAPFIWGKDIRFMAGLKNFTPSLAGVHGELALSAGEGEIKDFNKLLNSNVLVNILFSSLDVVSKVINSLDVISLLEGLGGGNDTGRAYEAKDMVVKTVQDDQGRDVQILVPYEKEQIDGTLAFEQFKTEVLFTDGLAHMKRGAFVSDLLSFNAGGDMNFKSRDLAMTVQAAPGRHYEGGIMPMTIDIGGTIEEPQGSLRVASSVTSMLTQSVTNNFFSRTVRKGWSAVAGLFKKKKNAVENEPVGPVLNTAAGADARVPRASEEKQQEAFPQQL